MGVKKLISPEFKVTVGDYEVTEGIEVECFSSKESHMDWCRVELSPQLQGVLKFKDMDEASVELGYEDDFDSLIEGYVRCGDTDYWKEIMIKDDMMKLDRVTIKASFVDCEPQDVIRYVLTCAGIEDYVLSDENYGKKSLFVIDRKSGINTIAEVNSSWGIKNPFFFQKKVFYWGTKEEQEEMYVLEEGETILYTAKTETALSGCKRGVEGAARAWTAGELIGRNFTAKDHADLIAAISETRGAASTAAL